PLFFQGIGDVLVVLRTNRADLIQIAEGKRQAVQLRGVGDVGEGAAGHHAALQLTDLHLTQYAFVTALYTARKVADTYASFGFAVDVIRGLTHQLHPAGAVRCDGGDFQDGRGLRRG